jgi:hypothetical protein
MISISKFATQRGFAAVMCEKVPATPVCNFPIMGEARRKVPIQGKAVTFPTSLRQSRPQSQLWNHLNQSQYCCYH